MPLYEHECSKHGKFEELRDLKESGKSALCPICKESCPQVISSFGAILWGKKGHWNA